MRYRLLRTPIYSRTARLLGAWLFVPTLLVSFVGCSKEVGAKTNVVPPAKMNLKRSVELDVARREVLNYSVEMPGVLEAEQQTDIAAGVSGRVDEVLFREGDEVTQDTILIKVDQARYKALADTARANEARSVAAMDQAKDAHRRAVEAGKAIADEERVRTLSNLQVAQAELNASKSNTALAEIQLARSVVHPPYAGKVNQRKVYVGNYVEDKTTIATIADLSRLRLVGWVPESAALSVRQRMLTNASANVVDLLTAILSETNTFGSVAAMQAKIPFAVQSPHRHDVEFRVLSDPKKILKARLFYLSTVANPETHMFESKSEVMYLDKAIPLQPGFTARISFPLQTNSQACIIPEEAARPNEKGFVAFVPIEKTMKDGKKEWVAQARVIEPGFRSPGKLEIRAGIQPGELIIRRGADALEDGTPIQFSSMPKTQ